MAMKSRLLSPKEKRELAAEEGIAQKTSRK
jgi:hypothetical protein